MYAGLSASGPGRSWAACRMDCIAEQNIGQSIALFLAVVPKLQYGWDVLDPGHFHRRANVQHNNGVGLCCYDAFDEFILCAGQFHIDPVRAFRLPIAIKLAINTTTSERSWRAHSFGNRSGACGGRCPKETERQRDCPSTNIPGGSDSHCPQSVQSPPFFVVLIGPRRVIDHEFLVDEQAGSANSVEGKRMGPNSCGMKNPSMSMEKAS